MSDLAIRPLGELILIKKGKKPASVATNRRNEADRPYLLIESFGGNYKSFTDDSSCPYSSREDTLLVWDGERCGLTSTGHEGYIGPTLASIRGSTGDLEPSYLYHFLASKRKAIRNSAEGTGVPHVSRRFLEGIEILLPPLPEQKKIAEILSGIDHLIRREDECHDAMSSLLQSHLRSQRFSNGESIAISDACLLVADCIHKTPVFEETGFPIVRTPNVRDGRLVHEGMKGTSKKEEFQACSHLQKNALRRQGVY